MHTRVSFTINVTNSDSDTDLSGFSSFSFWKSGNVLVGVSSVGSRFCYVLCAIV